jgi:hypothetical protein
VQTGRNDLTFNVLGSVHRKNILTYIQQDATLHSLFYLETALRVSGGIFTHHRERKQLYLQHHVEQFPDKINCVTLHLVGYTLEYAPTSLRILLPSTTLLMEARGCSAKPLLCNQTKLQ